LLAIAAALSVITAPFAAESRPTGQSKSQEEILTLSPFTVSAELDKNWEASNTLSATRTNQELKDVPISIDAITQDFIEDLNLFTADDLAGFVANVYAAPHLENEQDQHNFSFRGLNQRFNISRNYFRWYIPTDNYNVERIDFGKGSNSLIFGDVEPGGQGAVFTKRAQMKNSTTIFSQYGTNDVYRVQIDVNRKLTRNLAVRLNAVERRERTFQDFSNYGYTGQHLTATWRPFRHTQLRVEAEQGKYQNARGFAQIQIREQSARSRAFTADGWWYTSDGELFERRTLPAADRTNGPAGGTPTLLEGGFFDVSMRNAAGQIVGTKHVTGFPLNYNIRGTNDSFARPFNTYSIYLEQHIGSLGLELSYNRQNQEWDRNDVFFSNTLSVDVNGRIYNDCGGIDYKADRSQVDAYRLTAVYPWQVLPWMKQSLVVMGEYREDFNKVMRYLLLNTAGIRNGTATEVNQTLDRVRFRYYLDDPRFYSGAFFDQFKAENLPTTATFRPEFYPNPVNPAAGTEWRQASSVGIAATGNYFNGRLQSLLGVRWDWNKVLEYVGAYRGPNNMQLPPPNYGKGAPHDYLSNPALDVFHTSYSAGVTCRLTRSVNVYASYGDSFRWQDARTFDQKIFEPIVGKTKEVGVKGSFWSNKATISAAAFHIDRENVEYRWTLTGFTAADAEELINPNNLTANDPGYFSTWKDTNQYRDVMSTETSRGWEMTLLTRPLRGLQARVTFARTNVEMAPDFSSFRAYYAAAVKRTEAALAPGGNPAMAEQPALLSDARQLLEDNDRVGKPAGARGSPNSGSWVFDYAFARDTWTPLRGVRIGVNGVWRSDYVIAADNNVLYYGGGTHTVGAYLMRDQKVLGTQVRVRMGAKNLTDLMNGKTRKTGMIAMSDGARAYRYSYIMPPIYELSATVRF
jgi:outer membrane receptor protein involved in Fe transport